MEKIIVRHRPANSRKKFIFNKLISIARYDLLGKESDKGYVFKLLMYVILIDTAFIYMRPVLYMATTMVKDAGSLLDPGVIWVPRTLYWGNLQDAFQLLKYPTSFTISVTVSLLISGLQVITCAVAGYAFARLEFPFKKFWFIALIFTFILPPQVIILPTILLFKQFNWLDTYLPMIIPAIFGHGLRGSLFVIIYRQFFSTQPKELEEAARLEGASVFRIFYRVMLPISSSAIIVVFLFSFVWNWNDSYFPTMYLFQAQDVPLSISSARLAAKLALEADQAGPSILAEPIKMAASFLIIMPVLIVYTFTQRWFVEGVGRTGMVE
ncbi:lactose transport system permease protein LacG [Ruminiclostridium hungatei]|uniref:Lactose transport system permease protein LacG n=1 Tax=Ruminiclostridium hungatei TaxID=48256 RepID=A0A1V4SNB2_RUMHU|nr:carbohydrate ABC transporter permease [Ruminiclostridium hungatei]OPX44966.1 lactose transport system permease protein LacG [Ruminiclostridium hungatei]